jgi:predicted MPP superfamily phosphohydrolase
MSSISKSIDQGPLRGNSVKTIWTGFVDLIFQGINRVGHAVIGHPKEFKVETIPLKLRRLPPSFSGFRLAQVSDIHMGGWMNAERLQQVADQVIAEKPDVLMLTGDFLKGRVFSERARQGIQDLIQVLGPLAKKIPSFAVLGNHDYAISANAVREMLDLCKIKDMTNTVYTFTRDKQHLQLCGLDDARHGDVQLDDVISHLDEVSPAILLVHEPDFADISAATGKFDLQISGHSHGGQIVLPLYGPPILPESGQKYPSGLYEVGRMIQYTNRGVGSDRFSLRINCPPEITIFVLEPDS